MVGLGNPILGDDGVGWTVLDAVAAGLPEPSPERDLDLVRLAVGGLRLMERLVGYERAILVDAVVMPDRPPGTVIGVPLASLGAAAGRHVDSSHDAPLAEALVAGRSLGATLPDEVQVVGVAIAVSDTFGEHLSPEVAAAVSVAANRVLDLLDPTRASGADHVPMDGPGRSEGPPVPRRSALPG